MTPKFLGAYVAWLCLGTKDFWIIPLGEYKTHLRHSGFPQTSAAASIPHTPQLCLPYPSLSPAQLSKLVLISSYFYLLWSGWGTNTKWWPTGRGGLKTIAKHQGLCEKRRERECNPVATGATD